MPRVLAAVALMNSSSFVSCCTVRSDCFSPLRMRAVSAGQPVGIQGIVAIAHQTAARDKRPVLENGRDRVVSRQRAEQRTSRDDIIALCITA